VEAVSPAPLLEQAVSPVETAASPVDDFEVDIAADERAALEDVSLESDALAELQVDEPALPIVLKPLAWLSAPLDRFPDEVRETLGKIAILTIVDALAVLVYVMMFRQHH
jgi:hypothetical protein